MQKKDIALLTSCERLAGYMLVSSKLAVIGARLRKDGREDHTWSEAEIEEWDKACDEIDPWWFALSEEEKEGLKNIEVFMADLTCARWPLTDKKENNNGTDL